MLSARKKKMILFQPQRHWKEKKHFGDSFGFPRNIFPSDFKIFHSIETVQWNMANHLLPTPTGIATFISLDLLVAFDIS